MAAVPAASLAQNSGWSNSFAKALHTCFRLHWVDTKEYTLAMLDAMAADSFDFKAHPTQRGFGDQLAHLGWANVASLRAVAPSLGVEDKLPKTYGDVRKEVSFRQACVTAAELSWFVSRAGGPAE